MLLELVRWNYDLLNITPKEGDPETYPLLEEDLSRIS
jgi:hypothetical protein